MENDTEKQILEELKEINQSLQEMKEENNHKKTSSVIFSGIGSFLVGFLVVACAMAVVTVIFQFMD